MTQQPAALSLAETLDFMDLHHSADVVRELHSEKLQLAHQQTRLVRRIEALIHAATHPGADLRGAIEDARHCIRRLR